MSLPGMESHQPGFNVVLPERDFGSDIEMAFFIGAVNLILGIALILAMVFHITESETSRGGGMGWGTVGGRRISTVRTGYGVETFFERFIAYIAIGFIVTSLLTAWFHRP